MGATAVSTRNLPVEGRPNWKGLLFSSTGVTSPPGLDSLRLAEIRARSDPEGSLGSLLVLKDRGRASGGFSEPGVAGLWPLAGNSV